MNEVLRVSLYVKRLRACERGLRHLICPNPLDSHLLTASLQIVVPKYHQTEFHF